LARSKGIVVCWLEYCFAVYIVHHCTLACLMLMPIIFIYNIIYSFALKIKNKIKKKTGDLYWAAIVDLRLLFCSACFFAVIAMFFLVSLLTVVVLRFLCIGRRFLVYFGVCLVILCLFWTDLFFLAFNFFSVWG
jgi:hypothetical protein